MHMCGCPWFSSTSPFTSTRTSSSFSFPSSSCTPTTLTPWLTTCATPPREQRRLRRRLPLTGSEPNDTELINDTELNDTVASKLTDSQGPPLPRYSFIGPGHGWHYARQGARWSTPRIRRLPQSGRCAWSVRRQCLSRPIERWNLWKRVTSINFVLVTQAERMVDRTVKPVEEITGIAEERESSRAQIRTLFDEQSTNDYRRMLRESCSSRIPSSSSRTRTENSTRRIMASAKGFSWSSSTKSYWDGGITKIPKFYIRYARKTEVHRGSEHYYGIIRKITRNEKWSKLQWTILRTSRTLNRYAVEISHVTSQPMLFSKHPAFEGLLRPSFVSPRRKEGAARYLGYMWYIRETFLQIPQASSWAPYPQELNSTWRKTIEEPIHMSRQRRKVEDQNEIKIWDASLDRQPKTQSSSSGGDSSENYGADQQRLQISDLHFDKFPTPANVCLLEDKVQDRGMYLFTFSRKQCNGSKKWSWLIRWMNWDLRHLLVVFQCRILKYLMRGLLQHWTKSGIIPISKEESVWRNKRPRSTNRFFRGRHKLTWSTITSGSLVPNRFCRKLHRPIYSLSFYEMTIFRNSILSGTEFYCLWRKSPHDDILEGLHKIENTRVWKTKDRIGIVRPGDSSEEVRTWLSQIENYGEEKYWAGNSKIWGKKWKFWEERRGQESGDKTAWTKNSWRLLAMGNQRVVCEWRQLQFPPRYE